MGENIKHLALLASAAVVGAFYKPPVLDIDLETVSDDELSSKIRELTGSGKVVIDKSRFSGPVFPWDDNRSRILTVEEAVNYLFQQAVEHDVFPLTKLRIYPVQYPFGAKRYTLVADSEMAGSKEPLPNAIGMNIKPVYK